MRSGTAGEQAPVDQDDPPRDGGLALSGGTKLRLVPLAITPRGDELMVGDPASGEFVVLPAIARVILDAIGEERPLAEVAAAAQEAAGEPVDVDDFAAVLIDLGFVSHVDDHPLAADGPRMHDGRAIGRHVAELARPLFSIPAWTLYTALGAACAGVLLLEPGYRPHARSLFFLHDPLASVALLFVINSVLVTLHESAHWLAARVEGAAARITIGRRLYILVAETDLTSLLALPRRRRFGALLAGIAFEVVMLSVLLTALICARHGLWHPPALVARLILALMLLRMTGIAFQFMVFLRTDLYAVLVIGLDCVQLTRTTQLALKRTLRRLRPHEATELAEADPRDLQVARYYRWLYVGGLACAGWYLATYSIPWASTLVRWITARLAHATPTQVGFWESLAFAVLALGPLLAPALMLAREQIVRRGLRAARGTAAR
jgi:hypothetical protein